MTELFLPHDACMVAAPRRIESNGLVVFEHDNTKTIDRGFMAMKHS